MLWTAIIAGGILVLLAITLFRKDTSSGIIKDQDFDSIKRSLWELLTRASEGSTLLIDNEPRKLMIGFIKIESAKSGRVRLVFPDTEWNKGPLNQLNAKLVKYSPNYELGDTGEVAQYFTATSQSNYSSVCDLARDAFQAVGFSDSDKFTIRATEYELDLDAGFDAAKYAQEIKSVEDIRL